MSIRCNPNANFNSGLDFFNNQHSPYTPQGNHAGQSYQRTAAYSFPNEGQGRKTYQYQQMNSPVGRERSEMYTAELTYQNVRAKQQKMQYEANFVNGSSLHVRACESTVVMTRESTVSDNRNGPSDLNPKPDFLDVLGDLVYAFARIVVAENDYAPGKTPALPPAGQTHSPNKQPLSITGTNHHVSRMKRIYVRRDVGFGNSLFVRGTGPGMSNKDGEGWKIGIQMTNDGTPDGWYFEIPENTPDFKYKVLVNNREWEEGKNREYEQTVRKQIIVNADSGWGNRIVLRMGNGSNLAPNSWESNIEGRCEDSNRWVFEVPENAPSIFEYKAVKIIGNNHRIFWEQDRNHIWNDKGTIKANKVAKQHLSPRF